MQAPYSLCLYQFPISIKFYGMLKVGIDVGSTTMKTVAMREERDIRYDMIISGPEGAMLGKGEFADQVCHYLKSISSAPYSPLHETKREKGGEDEG